MSSDFLFTENLLFHSNICRLCGQQNSNGELLYNEDEEDAISSLVNKYLPVKVKDDGKLPRTICPGCKIQLQSTVQFFDLLAEGQKKIRALFAEQREREKKMAIGIANIPEVEGEDGKLYMMITVPSEKDTMYPNDDPLTLKMEGLEKPRKKRGRPRKQEQEELPQETVAPPPALEPEAEVDADGRTKRKRKIPQRFLESVAGSELERVFKEQGVIDDDDKDRLFVDGLSSTEKVTEIIGRTVSQDGKELGELVVLTKSKGLSEDRQNFRPKKKLFTCSLCKKTFAKRKLFHIHRMHHHSWKFECEVCKEQFLDEESIRSHQVASSHEGIINLDEKNNELDNEILDPCDLSIETVVDPNSPDGLAYVCPACQGSFLSTSLLLAHMKTVHESLKPFKCSLCDKAFAFPKSHAKHMEAAHGVNESSLDESNEKKDLTCKICDKKFNHLSSLFYHKEAEHGPGIRFACNKCDKSFKHRQLLQRHQLVHTEERPYICTICTTSFKTKPNLTSHMITHTGEKKFFCDRCGQQFAHKTSLVLHHRWHNNEKPYQCKFCKKSFSQNGNLREHLRIHTGEKPFFCSYCGRRFTTSSQFKLHHKRHTGERPWKCDYCSKTFLHKDTWKCHVRRHKGEKPFSCNHCQRGFTEHWALRKHLRIHTGEKPYVCEICNKAFADCSNLNKHKKVHRGLPECELKSEAGDGNVVLQLLGEEDENGSLPVIYVSYNQQAAAEDIENNGNQPELVSTDGSVLRQITNVEQTGLVLSTADGQEVILNTLGVNGEIPMVVPAQSQLQLPEGIDAAGATLQMQTGEDGMSLPVTLAVKDGQLVAHIPTSTEFIKEKENSESSKDVMKDMHFHLVTEDGQAVQFIPNETDTTAAFSIDFSEDT